MDLRSKNQVLFDPVNSANLLVYYNLENYESSVQGTEELNLDLKTRVN